MAKLKKIISVTMSNNSYETLKINAHENGMFPSELMRWLLNKYEPIDIINDIDGIKHTTRVEGKRLHLHLNKKLAKKLKKLSFQQVRSCGVVCEGIIKNILK